MDFESVPFTVARSQLAELVGRVAYGGERIVLSRHGKPAVALVSIADLEKLQAMDAPEQFVRLGGPEFDRAGASMPQLRRNLDVAAEHSDPSRHDPTRSQRPDHAR